MKLENVTLLHKGTPETLMSKSSGKVYTIQTAVVCVPRTLYQNDTFVIKAFLDDVRDALARINVGEKIAVVMVDFEAHRSTAGRWYGDAVAWSITPAPAQAQPAQPANDFTNDNNGGGTW